jgi:hypothetical protein
VGQKPLLFEDARQTLEIPVRCLQRESMIYANGKEEKTMELRTQRGFLVLADISGYTFFLANTELEHADKAISILLECIVGRLSNMLTISKLEGDAVFAYIEESRLPGGTGLLELIDRTYLGFRKEAEVLFSKAACPCKACRAIPKLDLKFIVHHGDFIIQQVAGIKDLLGTDVNLVHKLLKNHVMERTGWNGYALFTNQALKHLQIDQQSFIVQKESYEHLGEVETQVTDMHIRYQKMSAY